MTKPKMKFELTAMSALGKLNGDLTREEMERVAAVTQSTFAALSAGEVLGVPRDEELASKIFLCREELQGRALTALTRAIGAEAAATILAASSLMANLVANAPDTFTEPYANRCKGMSAALASMKKKPVIAGANLP